MADKQIIAAQVSVTTGNSGAQIKELNKDTGALNTTLKNTSAEAKNTSKAIEGSTGSFGKLKEQMSSLPGPLGAAGEGVGKVSSAFKALLANPIVLFLTAIVAVLTLIYKAFTNTFEGGEKVEQVFAGIKAAGQALLDSLEKIGSAIVKLFSFDFSGAISDIKEVGNAAAAAFNKMSDLTKTAQALAREQATNDLEQVERQRKLSILREQATDESVPIAKRKAALKDLQKESEQNAKEDIDLAKRTADNKIAQLTLEKDGEKKNFVEIQKIKADALRSEIDNANELRRINKQVTSAEKQEQAERKEAQKAAAEFAKAERQKLIEFTNKLLSIQQANELALIKDGYDRELKALDNKIAADKRANQLAFQDKKITKQQQLQLDNALDIQLDSQKAAVNDKRNKETAKKEIDFQKELSTITQKTRLDAITDVRRNELVQLEIGYNEKLQQAIERYRDDQGKLQQIKAALDEELKAAQLKAQEKFDKEDAKKKFDLEVQSQQAIIDKRNFDFAAKLAAADAEQAIVQQAFDNKVISELDYNTKVAALADARKSIREQEQAHNQQVAGAIAGGLETLANIAGKQTAIGKALSIASTTINTFQSAIAAFRGMVSTIPGPVGIALGAVAAAGAVATGIAAVKKIVAVQIPGQGSGGGSVPTALPAQAAPVAPTQATTSLDAKTIGGIGNAATGRVFVLDADVKNNRDRDERLNRAARLGG